VRKAALHWFGLLGAPLAWTAQLLLGFGFAEGACNAGGLLWGIEPRTWVIVVTATAAAVALLAELSALAVWRDTRRQGAAEPPLGRIHFFSVSSLAVGVVFLAAILMGGIGAAYLGGCDQG
jgi:hypothetical protein